MSGKQKNAALWEQHGSILWLILLTAPLKSKSQKAIAAAITWEAGDRFTDLLWIRHGLDLNLALSQLTSGCTEGWREWIHLFGRLLHEESSTETKMLFVFISRAFSYRKTFCQKILPMYTYESGWFLQFSLHENTHWTQEFVLLLNLSILVFLWPKYYFLPPPGWKAILTTLLDNFWLMWTAAQLHLIWTSVIILKNVTWTTELRSSPSLANTSLDCLSTCALSVKRVRNTHFSSSGNSVENPVLKQQKEGVPFKEPGHTREVAPCEHHAVQQDQVKVLHLGQGNLRYMYRQGVDQEQSWGEELGGPG